MPAENANETAKNQPSYSRNEEKSSHFLRRIIEADLVNNTYGQRKDQGQVNSPKIRTRFPPEPNGFLHIGHIKSICLNFGLADDYNGVCHLRFDDTNPEKEEKAYVEGIIDAVRWLGFDWNAFGQEHLFYASNYFEQMYCFAQYLIEQGLAYVDEQSAEQIRLTRGDFTTAGTDSPYRTRSIEENLKRFRQMRAGALPDGAAVLRAKIDMASPNINMRDPAIYRIKHAHHHNTGDTWCIYPMYTFAHPIEDAIENITHSLCTLEFEDQRPFYDWLLKKLSASGLIETPPPRQYEFARLNLSHVITSKRKLAQLVKEGYVAGWDDPRMPTVAGLRRRGYTPESLRLFMDRIGVSKSDSWIDYSSLETAFRDEQDEKASRAMAVLDPLQLTIENWDEVFDASTTLCQAPVHPHHPEQGERHFVFSKHLWIERSDFAAIPPKGYRRLYPPHTAESNGEAVFGNKVRLKYAYVIECTGYKTDAQGQVCEVLAKVIPDTKSGTAGASAIKVKGVITWLAQEDAIPASIRIYHPLFTDLHPDSGGKDFLQALNPNSLEIKKGFVEAGLDTVAAETRFQFERYGYFVADQKEHNPTTPVFNRVTSLKDTWGK